MSSVKINGKYYQFSGGSLSVRGNTVIINGQRVNAGDAHQIDVKIEGEPVNIVVDNGDIYCKNVGGDINAGGSVQAGDIAGSIDAGGSVTAKNIGGNVDAGGSVHAIKINGDVKAGGSIHNG
jgi:hypothetical protein